MIPIEVIILLVLFKALEPILQRSGLMPSAKAGARR